jgi:Tol biopolymer transport system component
MPFWSPDSQWIGFFAGGSLRKLRISGGLPQTIANGASTFAGATWGSGDVILFPTGPVSGLFRVSANGGQISQITKPDRTSGEGGHLWPRFLGDGDHFIYAAVSGRGEPGSVYLASLSGEAPRIVKTFESGGASALDYASGHILFVDQGGGLFATAFDEERLEVTGEPVRIADGIPITGPGRAPFSASAAGTLAYWPYAVGTPGILRWYDRQGRISPAIDTPARYLNFRLSPDAGQLVFSRVINDGRADLWVRDLERGTESRLTSDGVSFSAVWSADGARLVYSSARGRPPELFIRNLRATGEDAVVSMTDEPDFPLSWSADGTSIVSVSIDPINRNDLWIWRLQDGKANGERLPLNTTFNEGQARLSPDGRWIAYVTDESGQDEVWIASFPSGADRRQISLAGGQAPEWGARGTEIMYISRGNEMIATPFQAGAVGKPQTLFRVGNLLERPFIFPSANVYTMTADAQRFLVAVPVADPTTPPISVVLNWRRLVGQ